MMHSGQDDSEGPKGIDRHPCCRNWPIAVVMQQNLYYINLSSDFIVPADKAEQKEKKNEQN